MGPTALPTDFELLGVFLREDGWTPELLADRQMYLIRYDTDDAGEIRIYAFIPDVSATLVVFGLTDLTVPSELRMPAAELVTRVNWGLRVGGFELHMDSGELRYKGTLDFYNCELTKDLARNLVNACLGATMRYHPAFHALIVEGRLPMEAVALVESES